jgi:hypothetical protein
LGYLLPADFEQGGLAAAAFAVKEQDASAAIGRQQGLEGLELSVIVGE